MASPSFRVGMRVVITEGRHHDERGTVGEGFFDEETRKYTRLVTLDESEEEIELPVKKLRPLESFEWVAEGIMGLANPTINQIQTLSLNYDPTRPPGLPKIPHYVTKVRREPWQRDYGFDEADADLAGKV